MSILIKNGRIIDPASGRDGTGDVLLRRGRIAAVGRTDETADTVIDAAGKVVCPGFVDIHMHEDPMTARGGFELRPESAISYCMLRMGVTTAVGGNCGINTGDPAAYLDAVDREGFPVNMAMLAGHAYFRERAGQRDKYAPATDGQIETMRRELRGALDAGCLGVSYGLRYVPGIDARELRATAAVCAGRGAIVSAHLRDDAAGVFAAGREFLDVCRETGLAAQVSHIGSMAGFGQMEAFLRMIREYQAQGLDVRCDCYPYYAFSTTLGSSTYDEGWMERYGCGYDAVELCEGPYKGRRCTRELFESTRAAFPECLTVCYVMQPEEVDRAFRDKNVMLGSDGLLSQGQGHPRAAGAFPRLLSAFVRAGKLSLPEAIDKMTRQSADRLGLWSKGRLTVGADADIVVFDPQRVRDRATFAQPTLAPEGIEYVILGGEIAVRQNQVVNARLGRAIRNH